MKEDNRTVYGKVLRTDPEKDRVMDGLSRVRAGDYYALGIEVLNGVPNKCLTISGCAGWATQSIGGDYKAPRECMSWGYQGHGSELLAAWLIKQAHGSWWYGEGFDYYQPKEGDPIVLRHYQQYAQEVVANLPDEWSIKLSDVREWVKKHENQRQNSEDAGRPGDRQE